MITLTDITNIIDYINPAVAIADIANSNLIIRFNNISLQTIAVKPFAIKTKDFTAPR